MLKCHIFVTITTAVAFPALLQAPGADIFLLRFLVEETLKFLKNEKPGESNLR